MPGRRESGLNPRALGTNPRAQALRRSVWVNKRSGVAHRRRDCEALRSVPDGALRQAVVENGLPRFRYCSLCVMR